ncbi:MAG TPA: hypothetical protein VFE42_33575 [Chloroflexota bacterium]|nr:hypothetical protein [Chloroflexota bacterium]
MPAAGLPGSSVSSVGSGFGANEQVTLHWNSASGTLLDTTAGNSLGSLRTLTIRIPSTATPGTYKVFAEGTTSRAQVTATFTVT